MLGFLDKDVVWKSKRRFMLIEEKLDELEQGGRRLDIRRVKRQINEITMNELRTQEAARAKVAGNPVTIKLCLWYSELQLLRGSGSMAAMIATEGLRKDEGATCYTELYHVDFTKLRQQIEDYEEELEEERKEFMEEWQERMAEEEEEAKEKPPEFKREIPPRVQKMGEVLGCLARGAYFAKEAKAWVEMENIVQTTWNAIKFDLTTPLELRETNAWRDVAVIAECVVCCLEHLKKGGSLRN